MPEIPDGVGTRTGARSIGSLHFRVGIVVASSLILLAVGILILGNSGGLFSRKVEFRLKFPGIVNLNEHAPVKLGGIDVGRVTEIRFPADPTSRYIVVSISVKKDVACRVREDTVASAKSLSLLSGEKYIELSLGNSNRVLPPGSEIPVREGINIDEIAGTGEQMAENLSLILHETLTFLKQINDGGGLLGKFVSDKDFGLETVHRLDAAVDSLETLLKGLEDGQGFAGRLLNDEQWGKETTESLRDSLMRVERMLAELDEGKGIAGKFLSDDVRGEEIVANLSSASASLRTTAEKLEKGTGLLSRLVNDEQFSEVILDDLKDITRSLSSILEKIDKGEGTIGKLIEDPSVYEDMRNIVAGINESRFLRWFLRNRAEKGERVRTGDHGEKNTFGTSVESPREMNDPGRDLQIR